MKRDEKLSFLKANHFNMWYATRVEVFEELAQQQSLFCCCGKLASGYHERYCKKFNHKVDSLTIKKLSYLLPYKTKPRITPKNLYPNTKC